MSRAKFGVHWSKNVAKGSLAVFAILRKKNYVRKCAWPMPKDAADSSESVCLTFWTVGGSGWEL